MKKGLFNTLKEVVNEGADFLPTPEVQEKPEVTPELVDELLSNAGGEETVDKEIFQQGLQTELEHYESVNNDMRILANIVLYNLSKSQNYYEYLSEVDAKIAEETAPEPEAEEEAPEAPVDEEEPVIDDEPIAADEGKIPDKKDDTQATIKTLLEGEEDEPVAPAVEETPVPEVPVVEEAKKCEKCEKAKCECDA